VHRVCSLDIYIIFIFLRPFLFSRHVRHQSSFCEFLIYEATVCIMPGYLSPMCGVGCERGPNHCLYQWAYLSSGVAFEERGGHQPQRSGKI